MRAILGIALIIVFVVRMLYRLFITRDLREHPDELYVGLGFTAMWALIYLLIFL